jgi:hypothetical protein
MDVVIADYVYSRMHDFNAGEDPKFKRILELARRLPPTYEPPSAYKIGGELLTTLYDVNWDQETRALFTESKLYGISMYWWGNDCNNTYN